MKKILVFAAFLVFVLSGCVQREPLGIDCEDRELNSWWGEGCKECICYPGGNSFCRDICVEGCGSHKLGDRWKHPDGCNTCSCTAQGEECTEIACYSKGECKIAEDCEPQGLAHIQCVGQWGCVEGMCVWECEIAVVCDDYRYSDCPESCVKTCVPSECPFSVPLGTILCTDDCEGEGSCTAPS